MGRVYRQRPDSNRVFFVAIAPNFLPSGRNYLAIKLKVENFKNILQGLTLRRIKLSFRHAYSYTCTCSASVIWSVQKVECECLPVLGTTRQSFTSYGISLFRTNRVFFALSHNSINNNRIDGFYQRTCQAELFVDYNFIRRGIGISPFSSFSNIKYIECL